MDGTKPAELENVHSHNSLFVFVVTVVSAKGIKVG